jgi:hypothetical protein
LAGAGADAVTLFRAPRPARPATWWPFGARCWFCGGAADSWVSDAISHGTVTLGDAALPTGGGVLGAAENAMKTGMSNASPPGSPTVGDGWGAGLSGVQGLACEGMDSQHNWNC